ncbi:MAG: tRNA uridine-5-carboxymethylaminomethyl(34) synthesis GTPase MnmE, partial [Thermus sp.]
PLPPERTIHVATKADLPPLWEDPLYLPVSSLTKEGLEALKEAIRTKLLGSPVEAVWLLSERQAEALSRARAHLEEALRAPEDLMGLSLEEAIRALNELLGLEVGEEVVERVFRNFCVGK